MSEGPKPVSERPYEDRVAAYRAYMTQITTDVQHILAPIDIVNTLAGAAVAVLKAHTNREFTTNYFLSLAADISAEPESGKTENTATPTD